MVFQLSELSENFSNFSGVTYSVAGITAAIVVVASLSRGRPNLDAIPTVGSSGWLGSCWAGLKHLINAADVIQEGYEKHKSAPFKYAEQYNWMVVLSNRKHVEELLRAPDDVVSYDQAPDQYFVKYTLGPEIAETPYHNAVVRSQLTRNIGALYHKMRDEVVTAFDEVLDLKDDEWKSVPALSVIQKVVCRASNRAFVGLPLCRDPDWIDLNIQHTIDVVKAGVAIGVFPEFMRPLAAYFFTGAAHRGAMRSLKHLSQTIEERLKYLNEYGKEWDGKPNDLLSWLMEEAEGPQLSAKALVTRVMLLNFASIHAISNSFTHALFYLAANPQYVQPLREEVESAIKKGGWSKAAIGEMRKLDSFLRESQRLDSTLPLLLVHKTLEDFTFSDGTFLPKGTVVGVAARSLHRDEKIYEDASVFEPFRFADTRGGDEEDGSKYQFVSTGTEYLPFGHGKHVCPGRYFSASEMKTMLAHIVLTYDIKLEDNATRPRSLYFGISLMANPYAKVVFRKRVN